MESISPRSYWNDSADDSRSYPPLTTNRRVDVAVVGGGITGLTAAMHLKANGLLVAVLEAGRIGAGTTGGTSGHLEILPDCGLTRLINRFGEKAAREIVDVRLEAINQIEQWSQQHGVECDFQRIPAYLMTEREDRVEALREEYEAARRLGMNVAFRRSAPLPFSTAGAIEVRDQARFHSLDYLHGLARHIHGDNGCIYEHTKANTPQDGKPCIIETPGGKIEADHVILATHSAYLGISQFDMRQAPYQSYVMAVRVQGDQSDALFFDDESPYHYLRIASSTERDLLIIGGEDHKTGQANEQERFDRLLDYVKMRFDVVAVQQQWSAELFEPSDGVPFIGRVPRCEHLYLATGFSGTGLTYGTAAGKILADLILDRFNSAAEVFSPSRVKPLAAGLDLISENLNAATHFITDRFRAPHVDSLEAVPVDEGRIVRFDGEVLAVYRDKENEVHALSPECTHAGCHVHWNSAEKTWDCPCHGSRFSCSGERIYGPARADLEPKALAHAVK